MAVINGTDLSDPLFGTAAADTISGGAGNDTIASALGGDVVAGGAGRADVLVVDYSLSATGVVMVAPFLTGPVVVGYPSPGGTTFSGTGGIGNSGGRAGTYTGFNTAQFDSLWWGPASIGAAMDGAIDGAGETLTFSSAVGGVLTYVGTTTVTTTTGTVQIFTKYVATIVGGAGDWVSAASVGISGGPGYVALINGSTFQVHQQIVASTTIDGTYVPINTLYDSLQTTGSQVRTSVTGQFAYDDGGLSGTIADAEGNSTNFSGIERFDLRTGLGNDNLVTAGADDVVRAGAGDDTVSGAGGSDTLFGEDGTDLLQGGGGDDSIDGGAGTDTMEGDTGDDVYVVDDIADTVMEVDGEGTDSVMASVSYILSAGVEKLTLTESSDLSGTGNTLDNEITGNGGANTLTGAGGNDSLGGLGGDDTLLTGDGNDSLSGGDGDDSISSGLGNDTVAGGAGASDLLVVDYSLSTTAVALAAPTLDGTGLSGAIADAGGNSTSFAEIERFDIRTGLGDDDISTGSADDAVRAGAGADTVSGESGSDTLFGEDGADLLQGGGGDDSIDGGAGADAMDGDAGDDTYVVDDLGDTVVEVDGEGTDAVTASITYTLGAGVENLTLTGSVDLSGTGNTLENDMTGNDGSNSLSGADGNDTLRGLGGNDTLVGGNGDDNMSGGGGDDTYGVDDLGDTVLELEGEGIDAVTASLSYTLGAGLENLTLTGSTNLNGTGNALGNIITGNTGANSLSGGDGNDALSGLAGTDTLAGGSGNDTLRAGEGNDMLTGGTGLDSMAGGAGNDGYSVDNVGDIAREMASQGTDRVTTNLSAYTLGANLEILVGSRALGQTLTGNTVANVITGARGGDTLNGLLGADTLNGGAGNDTLLGGDGADVLAGGAGRDVATGGAGADRFAFRAGDAGLTAIDVVQDFSRAQGDKIDFSGWDANAVRAGVQSFKWAGTAAFHGIVGELRVAALAGGSQIQGDLNGDGTADFKINVQTSVTIDLSDLIGVVAGVSSAGILG